jgi:hypothetical protein
LLIPSVANSPQSCDYTSPVCMQKFRNILDSGGGDEKESM